MARNQWALGFVMMILGLLLSTQFRVQEQVPPDPAHLRAEELALQLRRAQELLRAAQAERDRLAAELEAARRQGETAAPPLTKEERTARELLSGLAPVEGPGVVVTLTEGTDGRARIRDEDLWLVVNELLAGGAEAVAVNGQRLTAVSGIRNVGQRILIGDAMTAAPFEVAAIGDPGVLEAALRMRGGVVDVLKRWGIEMAIARVERLSLPALPVAPEFRHARPVR